MSDTHTSPVTALALADFRDKAYERLLKLCGTRSDAPRWDDILTLLRERNELHAQLRSGVAQCALPSVNAGLVKMLESCPLTGNGEVNGLLIQAAAALKRLKDPVAVHINMLRGGIAKPSWENIEHLYPVEVEQLRHPTQTTSHAVEPVKWRAFESVLERGSFGVETSDPELVEECDEKVIYHGLTKPDAERIVCAFNAAIAKMTVAAADLPSTPSAPGGQWQPIETARHKDGTRILAWDGKQQFVCRYKGENHKPHEDKPGWFEQWIRMHPTHWKPLGPKPDPAVTSTERCDTENTDGGAHWEPSREEANSRLPLQYEDGLDYCTVKDAQGRDFALTMHPALMKAMETALRENTARLKRNPDLLPTPSTPGCALDGETIQTLLDLLNPLHGDLDKQTYDAKVAMEFDMPSDYAHDVTVTAQQERDLTQAVCILENRIAALTTADGGGK